MKSEIKIVAFDMDGTLLDENKIITKNTLDALKKLHEMDVKLVLATGRLYESVLSYKEIIGVPLSICCTNGSLAFDEEGVEIYNKPLTGFEFETSISLLRTTDLYFHLYKRDTIVTPYGDDPRSSVVGRMPVGEEHRMKREIKDFYKILASDDDIYKIIIIEEDEKKREEFRNKLIDAGIKHSSSWYNNIEITSNEATKKEALQRVLHRYNLTWNEVAAFGDNENDLPMLLSSKYPFLMGNAYSKLKENYDLNIIPKNSEEGVYKTLKEIFEL